LVAEDAREAASKAREALGELADLAGRIRRTTEAQEQVVADLRTELDRLCAGPREGGG
jgi:plasmid stabilization system protein ParE